MPLPRLNHAKLNKIFRSTAVACLGFTFLGNALTAKDRALDRLVPVPAEEKIPVIDFFRPWLFTKPELNSAGTHFAAIVSTGEDRHDLISFELATRKMNRMSAGSGYDVSHFTWLGDKRLLFSVASGKLYANGLYAVELDRFSASYPLERYSVVVPVGFPQKNPLEVILWISQDAAKQGRDGGLVRVDTRRSMQDAFASAASSTGNNVGIRATIVRSYPSPVDVPVGYLPDRDGELAFALTSRDGVSTLHRLVDQKWLPCPVSLDDIEVIASGDVPGEVIVLAPKQTGKPRALHRMDATTGKLGELLYEDPAYDLASARVFRSPADNHILGIQYQGFAGKSVWFDPSYQAIQSLIERNLPKLMVRIVDCDRAQKHFFISASSDTQPTTYYHLDLNTKSCTQLTSVAPWIDPNRMQPMRPFSYKTRDGVTQEGYVTLPAAASKEKPAPLVVLPHGGPWARNTWGFDPEAQFLASRGYAVFQPNYRGSTDYDWKFAERDLWDFLKMDQDVTDGVRSLFKTGLVDPDRVAIMGGSFGGYLALSGVAHEPDLYRCAVTIAGVFDWEKMLKDARGSTSFQDR